MHDGMMAARSLSPTCSSATSLCHVLLGKLRCFLMAPLSAEQAADLAWPMSGMLLSDTAEKARSSPSKQSRQLAKVEEAMLHGRPANAVLNSYFMKPASALAGSHMRSPAHRVVVCTCATLETQTLNTPCKGLQTIKSPEAAAII